MEQILIYSPEEIEQLAVDWVQGFDSDAALMKWEIGVCTKSSRTMVVVDWMCDSKKCRGAFELEGVTEC